MFAITIEGWLMLSGSTLLGLAAVGAGLWLLARRERTPEVSTALRAVLVTLLFLLGGVALFAAFVMGSCAFGSAFH